MLRGVVLLLVLLCVSCAEREPAWPSVAQTWPVIREVPTLRLPPGVTPISQQLELKIDPRKDWYTGNTEIVVEVAGPTSVIWLNSEDLRVLSATVTPEGGPPMHADYTEHGGSGFASIRTKEPVPAGRARIALRFGAVLREGKLGLYKIEEADRWYVFTQLQPISARAAFPCFDEPGFKIPFDVTLVVPSGMQATSNGRELSRSTSGEQRRVQFATTAKLPVYLVTVAVGDFEVVDVAPAPVNDVRGTPLPLRVLTPRGTAKAATTMVEVVAPLLAQLEAYTGIAYPYEKLDIIVEPRKAGGMEGAGAITIGTFLLPDEESPSELFHRMMIEIMSHELAHMWVGDLVTLAWWDDVWLNEGFATWLGAKAAHAWDPTPRLEESLRQDIDSRLERDDLATMRAIREPIRAADDIEAAFDHVVYEKGAGVLIMFERWAGAEVWQRGFRSYLQRHRDGHVTTADFAAEMSATIGTDIRAALDSFLNQRGAPVVSFALQCSGKQGSAQVALRQTAGASFGLTPSETRVWGIPVCVRYGGKVGGDACTLLIGRTGAIALPANAGCPAWILPNADSAGYYRSSMGTADHLALRKHGFDALTDNEKTTYVDSLLADYRRGALPFGDAVEILRGNAGRLNPRLVKPLRDLLVEARSFLANGPLQARVERYARELYGPALRPLGYDHVKGEKGENSSLRWRLLEALFAVGRDEPIRREAKRRATRYFASSGDVGDGDRFLGAFRDIALTIAGEEADGASVEILLQKYENAPNRLVQWAAKTALLNVQQPAAVSKVLASEFVESIAEEQMLEVMSEDAGGSRLAALSWGWLATDGAGLLRKVVEREGPREPASVIEKLCDDQPIGEAEQLLLPLVTDDEHDRTTVSDALARARRCVAARKVHEPEMRAYFQSK